MFSKKSYDGPPGGYGPPTGYGPPAGDYGYDYGARSPPPGSYYIEDVPQHFYKWTSPPGVVRILEAIVILLCIAIFACVASTLAWEYGYGFGGVYGGGCWCRIPARLFAGVSWGSGRNWGEPAAPCWEVSGRGWAVVPAQTRFLVLWSPRS
uniref:MARVEL domain-containing protein n=1 Tax=Accipiter nisus TaxID=211598 RepID=A0A8B9S0E4_9AVES